MATSQTPVNGENDKMSLASLFSRWPVTSWSLKLRRNQNPGIQRPTGWSASWQRTQALYKLMYESRGERWNVTKGVSTRLRTIRLDIRACTDFCSVHPPWMSVDSSHGCHDDGSTARVARATRTVSVRWRDRDKDRCYTIVSSGPCLSPRSKIVTCSHGKLITTPVNSLRECVQSARACFHTEYTDWQDWHAGRNETRYPLHWRTRERDRPLLTLLRQSNDVIMEWYYD